MYLYCIGHDMYRTIYLWVTVCMVLLLGAFVCVTIFEGIVFMAQQAQYRGQKYNFDCSSRCCVCGSSNIAAAVEWN